MTENTVVVKSRKKPILVIVIIAAVVVVGLIVFMQLSTLAQSTSVVIPETFMLNRTSLESKVTASGNFTSSDPVTVGSNVQGAEVETVYVEAGSYVYAGDVIARLKTSDISRSISDAQAGITETARGDQQRLDSAQRAFDDVNTEYYANERQLTDAVNMAQASLDAANRTLTDAQADPAATPEQLDQLQSAVIKATAELAAANSQKENTMRGLNSRWYDAQANLNAAKLTDSSRQQRSQLDQLKENLSNASIVSPITGIVTQVNTEAGMAAMGTMFIIENTETLQIEASVAEYDVIKIEPGMKAHVTSNATGDTVYDAVVDFVAPVAKDANGSFQVKVLVTSPIGELKPGMTATVEIVTSSKDNVFAVPIDAVVTKPNGTKVVYVFEPGSGMVMGAGRPGGGPISEGEGPVIIEGEGPEMVITEDPGQISGGADRREIVVTTGMETDFFIEIISSELTEGMLILSDPNGRNVRMGPSNDMMMMGGPGGGGQTVYVEAAAPVGSSGGGGTTTTVTQSGGGR